MIIGISAGQGQGKSTLIREAIKYNSNIKDPTIQTSRVILKDWGYSLTEINKYMPLKIKFQEEFIKRHVESLTSPKNSNLTFLVERTFADIFAYTLLSVGPFNEYSDWLNEYAIICKDAQQEMFDHVVFISGRDYEPEDDGVRSINPHFSNLADYLIKYYTESFSKDKTDITAITHPELDKRVFELQEIVEKLVIEKNGVSYGSG